MSIKTENNKFTLINQKIKYGTDAGINVRDGTLFTNPATNRVGINTLNPAYPLDVSGSIRFSSMNDYTNSTGQNTQVFSKVNNQNFWTYPQYQFQGNDFLPLNEISTFTNLLPGTSYRQGGGCLSPNGYIYLGPFGSYSDGTRKTLKLNPYNNSRTYISNNGGNYGYGGMVCANNGKIFMALWSGSTSSFQIIDTFNNDAVSYFNVSGYTTSSYFGLVNFNNYIYAIPSSSSSVLRIDPVTLTTSSDISGIDASGYDISANSDKFRGGVVGPDGKIYCIPSSARRVLRFNPQTNVVEQSSTTGVSGYQGGALAPNGNIYMVPKSASDIGVIDPVTFTVSKITTYIATNGTVTNISSITGTFQKFCCAITAPNGLIYCIPEGGSVFLTIDPATNIARQIGTGWGGDGFSGAVLSPNGKIYVSPLNANYLPIIKTGFPTQDNWMLAPQFNKSP